MAEHSGMEGIIEAIEALTEQLKLTNALMRFVFRGLIAFLKTRVRAFKRKKQLSIERNVQP